MRKGGKVSNGSSEIALDVLIVVVAFNEAERIGECLQALLNQDTELRYGVLVVDDGSTDATSEIVKRIQASDLRLSLIRHEVNRGRGAARRTGQDANLAPRVAFVDADIVVPRGWLQRCSDALAEYSAVSAVALPDGDAAVIWRLFGSPIRFRVGFSGITGNNVIFDAAVLRAVPFQAQYTLGEDFRLSHRLMQKGYRLTVMEDFSVEHRESKRYGATIEYMWDTGIDATSHPFEFRIIRLPDVSWVIWLLWCLASLIAAVVGWWSWTSGLLSVLGVTVIVSLAYTFSRFHVLPNPFRWMGSALASIPLIVAYLVGRSWGLVKLRSTRRRVDGEI
jgi:glycosyltransferase involved in cell wall biosynthesis